MSDITSKRFLNADQQPVQYDGSPISWRVSAYVLVEQDNQILLCKSKLEQLYDAVGGGIDLGETITEALKREALEEAGAEISIGNILHAHVDWFYHRNGQYYQTLLLFYTAQLTSPLHHPTDPNMEMAQFVPKNAIGTKFPVPPIVQQVINQYLP